MKIVQKGNKQLRIADEQLDNMLARGFSEVDQKTGKLIGKKDPNADKITSLEKENAELKKENKALKEQIAALTKSAE